MPELPEVESVRRGLEQLLVDRQIATVLIDWPRIITTDQPLEQWSEQLCGQTITAIRRRGKYLLFDLTHNVLISHLRMEGKFHYYPEQEVPAEKDKHTHVRFVFTDNSQLHYHDVRKFGRMELIEPSEEAAYFLKKKIGPEPMKEVFNQTEFKKQLAQSKKVIKPLLLEQHLVAGIGNIYADEILFQAKIHPTRRANTLSDSEMTLLYEAIVDIMERAIQAGGSSVRSYVNSFGEAGRFQEQHQVYGRKDEPCFRCGTLISKIQLAGRGTHFCRQCQQEQS